MNREILLEASIAVTVGLLVATLAAYRSQQAPKPAVMRRGAMAALLVYAVIAAGPLVATGMTLIGLLVLLALMALPLLANVRFAAPSSPAARLTAAAVAVGLTAAMLIAAGQTLALLGRVDPRMVVLAIVTIAALLVGGQGLVAAGRIGSTTIWLLIVPITLSLALGVFVGAPGQVTAPIIKVPGLDLWQVVGLAVAFIALGAADTGLGALRTAAGGNPVRVWIGAAAVVTLVALGQLMFLGGAVISPSLQFFVFPSNIDIMPGLAGVLLALTTLFFTALVVAPLTAVTQGTEDAVRWLVVGTVAAAVIALVDPGLQTVVLVASLLSAALLGAQAGRGAPDRGVKAGLIAVVVATLGLFLLDETGFGLPGAGATVIVAAVAFGVARAGQESKTEQPVAR